MTALLDRLEAVASDYDAIVFDQWGVLHNGTTPYPGAVACLEALHARGTRMAVLSNSGKRAAPNAARIAAMGFDSALWDMVMTSGEALWRELSKGTAGQAFFPVERQSGDAAAWAAGLDIALTDLDDAKAVLLMGLPDGSVLNDWEPVLDEALSRNLPVFCSNPDRASPRGDGLVISPGALAFRYKELGGPVSFYGKPHRPVFDALETALGSTRLLMVGDSLEHDIAGACGAGWDSLLIQGGLYAEAFASGDQKATLDRLVTEKGGFAPTYRMDLLQ